jgi:hypothetical protein
VRSYPLPESLAGRAFTTAEAIEAGVGRGVLKGPRVRRILPGVYIAADQKPTDDVVVGGALKLLPADALVNGVTALRLWGVRVGSLDKLDFVTTHLHQVRQPAMRVVRASVLPQASRRSGFERVVVPEHAFVSSAPRLDLVDLVTAGDWLTRLRLATPESLVSYARTYRGSGAALARRAAGLVRRRADSLRESQLRMCLVLSGLPEPECNLTLGSNDFPIGRVDLVYEEFKVIIEYEGDHNRTDSWQWNLDIGRYEEFTAAGWCVVRVTAPAMRNPRAVVARVHLALRRAGYRGKEPRFRAEWIRLFESSTR